MTPARTHLVIIIVACVAALVLGAMRRAHVASHAAFVAIAEAVRKEYRDGDLIVVVPFHQSTPRLLLGDLPLIEPRAFEAEELRMHQRLLLVSVAAIGGRADLLQAIESLGRVSEVAKEDGVRFAIIDVDSPSHAIFELARTFTTVGNGPHRCVVTHGTVSLPAAPGRSLVVGFGVPASSRSTTARLQIGQQRFEATRDWQVVRLDGVPASLTSGEACVDAWVLE